MRFNLASALLGLVLLCTGVALALGVGWSLVVAGGVLLLVGLLRDDEKEPTA